MENIVIEETKTERLSAILESLKPDEKKRLDVKDRKMVMTISGQMKRFTGKEFTTTIKGQPAGKFAVWRIK